MSVTLRQTDDLDLMREMDALAFPGIGWPGDDYQYWVLRNDKNKECGYCCAKHYADDRYVYLGRAAVVESERGHGLQRRMIQARVRWARSHAARNVITYTSPQNYESMINLLKCGFRFYTPIDQYGMAGAHYFKKQLLK